MDALIDGKPPGRPVLRVDVDELDSGATVRLMTTNSTYVFVLSDPKTRRGTISGGVLGNVLVQAIATRTFTTGVPAILFIQRDGESQHEFTTSFVQSIEISWMQ